MKALPLATVFLLLATATLPVHAQQEVGVNITGGSEAGQSCVLAKRCYDPDTVTVSAKTAVVWTNIDATAHTVTSGTPSDSTPGTTFDSGQVAPGGTYTFIFMSPGTYSYFCTIHPWMTGQVIVTGANSPAIAVPEFGALAGAVFFAAALSAVLITSKKKNLLS